ncbi:MAG: 2Fe-2S iron-sulfur cluster binding domain-containing protein, partial [Proteobacteria bacterium]|nr:2Fe-2S iron-sulfur cluster binding domain-containing protein [Pseudomonadota bacterium]
MPLLTFQPSGKSVDVAPGTELLEAAKQAGVEMDSPCGTQGTCGRCIVRIVSGDATTEAPGLLSRTAVGAGYVHACKTCLGRSPVVVEIPEPIDKRGAFADTSQDISRIDPQLLPKIWQHDPLAVKCRLDVPKPQPEDGLSDMDRLTRSIRQAWGEKRIEYPLPVIRRMAESLRVENGSVTVTLVQTAEAYHVADVEAGDRTERNFGIAVDIGTTTVSVQLVSLPGAEILSTRTDYNHQIPCGIDVIGRINYARRRGGL